MKTALLSVALLEAIFCRSQNKSVIDVLHYTFTG